MEKKSENQQQSIGRPALKIRFVAAVVLIPLMLAFIVYGLSSHSVIIQSKADDKKASEPLILNESAITRDVTVGGLVLLDSGEIVRTYSGKPPEACPT